MPKKPRGKPPSERPERRPGGAHRQKPLNFDGRQLDVVYARTFTPETPEPVVFIINVDDEVGFRLGKEVVGLELVEEILADYRHSRHAATMTLGVESAEGAAAILSFHFKEAKSDLDQPLPSGHYRVVIVDAGGMTCRSRPIPKFEITGKDSIRFDPS